MFVFTGDKWNESFEYNEDKIGVMIHQELRGMPCTYAVTARSGMNVIVSRTLSFDPLGDGSDLWNSIGQNRNLDDKVQRVTDKTSKNHNIK